MNKISKEFLEASEKITDTKIHIESDMEYAQRVDSINTIEKWKNSDGKNYVLEDLPFDNLTFFAEPEVITNPYSGVKVTLNPVEVAIYDATMGAYHIHIDLGNVARYDDARKWYKEFHKGKNWFIENNIKAHMTLID